jgi:hypothetical protein
LKILAHNEIINLTRSPVFKKFGVRGLKLYAMILFSVFYLMLIAITAGFCIYSSDFEDCRISVSWFAGVLIVFSASLLTRMHSHFQADIKRLEPQEKAK